jgi:translation elongation factor EF-Tu-like GTPase
VCHLLTAAVVAAGVVKTGEEVDIVGMKEGATKSTVTGVEMFKKQLNQVRGPSPFDRCLHLFVGASVGGT